MKTIGQIIHNKTYPLELLDSTGKERYFENSRHYWSKMGFASNGEENYWEDSAGAWQLCEYDENNTEIYYEDSSGLVQDNRP